MIEYPVYIVADCESIIKDIEPCGKSMKKTAEHIACAYALKVSSNFEEWDLPVEHFRGENAAEYSIGRLHELYEELSPIIFANKPMKKLTPEKNSRIR